MGLSKRFLLTASAVLLADLALATTSQVDYNAILFPSERDNLCAGGDDGNIAAGACLPYYFSCLNSQLVRRECRRGRVYNSHKDRCVRPGRYCKKRPDLPAEMLECFNGNISASGKEIIGGGTYWPTEVQLDVPVEVAAQLMYFVAGGCDAVENLQWLPIGIGPKINGIRRGAKPGDVKITSIGSPSNADILLYLNCDIDYEKSCIKRTFLSTVQDDTLGTYQSTSEIVERMFVNDEGRLVLAGMTINCDKVEGGTYTPEQEQVVCRPGGGKSFLAWALEHFAHSVEYIGASQGFGPWGVL